MPTVTPPLKNPPPQEQTLDPTPIVTATAQANPQVRPDIPTETNKKTPSRKQPERAAKAPKTPKKAKRTNPKPQINKITKENREKRAGNKKGKKKDKKDRRAKAKEEKGKPPVTRVNQLMKKPNEPNWNYFNNTANAADIKSWLTAIQTNDGFPKTVLDTIMAMDADNKAQAFRKAAFPIWHALFPDLVDETFKPSVEAAAAAVGIRVNVAGAILPVEQDNANNDEPMKTAESDEEFHDPMQA